MARQGWDQDIWPRGMLDYQHPRLESAPPSGPGWIHEVKFDGYRMQLQVRAARARLFTRNGHDWTDRLPTLAVLAGELEDCVIDAELCALTAEGYSSFSALRSALAKGRDGELTFMCFDLLWRDYRDLRGFPIETRKVALRAVLEAAPHVEDHLRYVEPIEAGRGEALLDAACALKWEGIVSKRAGSAYKAGRGEAWIKSKCRPTETVVVGGWKSDKGLGFKQLLVGVREPDGRLRYAGSVKSGFSRERGLLAKLRAIEAAAPPFDVGTPRKTSDMHWTRPELLAEVEIAEFTASGKLRQATFKGLREDVGER